jgi:hypothetical protein
MNLSAPGNQAHNTNRGINMNRILISIFLLIFLINCGGNNSDSSCTECGGGIIDGYTFTEVTPDNIGTTNLTDKNISVNDIGKCIRVKMDLTDNTYFEDVSIVEDCCCVEFQ